MHLPFVSCDAFAEVPFSQKQLQNKKQDLAFSLLSCESESSENLRVLIFFLSMASCCGLCVPNMIITKANAKEIWGIYDLPFPCESENETKSPDFHL